MATDPLNEQTDFAADNLTLPEERNFRLSELLRTSWVNHQIVRIERIAIGRNPGWRVVFRN